MRDIEIAIVYYLNEMYRKNAYHYENHQMLHGVKFSKNLSEDKRKLIRENYKGNCVGAAYELKTYYMENGIPSNTIVLKMRPEIPESKELRTIKIWNEQEQAVKEYFHHAIEIFKENGRYKVWDVLHSDKTVWLETYLDEVCSMNKCERKHIRYDMGYLASCNVYADNMYELSDLLKYLDKKYQVGKPRLNLIDISDSDDEGMWLSDDVAMDFELFGKAFGVSKMGVIDSWSEVCRKLFGFHVNMLHLICLANIKRDPLLKYPLTEGIFDDVKVCDFLENM